MPKPKIFFRADGNSKMGLGHVIRSLALADMLHNDFEIHFIIRNPLSTLKDQILEVSESIISLIDTDDDIEEVKRLTENYLKGNEIVVLDGYHFKTEYQKILKEKGCRLVCIDDIYAYHFLADIVINHAGGIPKDKYSTEEYTQVYLGLKYAILRKEFLEAARKRKELVSNNNVFICFGGADPNNDTLSALKKCEAQGTIGKCYLVIGGAYRHQKALTAFLNKSPLNVQLLNNLSASEMVAYMKKCSKAITPPSTISYEYLSVGGSLFLKVIADNQLNINTYFLNEQLAFPFESFPVVEEHLLNLSLKKQIQQLDGQTAKRFIKIFKSIC